MRMPPGKSIESESILDIARLEELASLRHSREQGVLTLFEDSPPQDKTQTKNQFVMK